MKRNLTLYFLIWMAAAASAAKPPNVVFFLADDLGWSDTTLYGTTQFYETPNIDRLAKQGVRFSQAYAACHVCSPTRASILTGKYPARLHLTDWLSGRRDYEFQKLKNARIHQQLPLEETTLAETLKQHGYATGHFGKWHLGEDPGEHNDLARSQPEKTKEMRAMLRKWRVQVSARMMPEKT